MSYDPDKDGIDHLNIYSKGKTELGKFLTNFATCKIFTVDGYFNSIEGYWYWLGCKDERLRDLSGYAAKKLGRELRAPDWQDDPEFKKKICLAIEIKLETKEGRAILAKNKHLLTLPLVHYYNFGGKIVEVEDGKWILEHIIAYIKKNVLT